MSRAVAYRARLLVLIMSMVGFMATVFAAGFIVGIIASGGL